MTLVDRLKRRFLPAAVAPPAQTRRDLILKHVRRDMRGLEIGPNYSPLTPRREGYDCLSLDVFPTEEVRRRALDDPNVPSEMVDRIEAVDLVGSACDIGQLTVDAWGAHSLDYIISSHNFEHLPDPIMFLRGCDLVLRHGGHLSMAIPDLRYCLDHFRWPTVIGDWVCAYFEKRVQPTPGQLFAAVSTFAHAHVGNEIVVGFDAATPKSAVVPDHRLEEAYETWRGQIAGADLGYTDCHCWAFTPASAALLLLEARFLGLIELECVEYSEPMGCEFFVHLRHAKEPLTAEEFYPAREALMRLVIREIAAKA